MIEIKANFDVRFPKEYNEWQFDNFNVREWTFPQFLEQKGLIKQIGGRWYLT